jgi:hypothetical protein
MALLAGGETRRGRGPILHAVLFGALAALGIASIVYLLMPRWGYRSRSRASSSTSRRRRFAFRCSAVPGRRIASTSPMRGPTYSHAGVSMARLFVDIEPTQSAMLPSERLRSIYPRYADTPSASGPGGLVIATFRDDSPYAGEDLLYDPAAPDRFLVRCDRSHGPIILAMCLYERPDGAATLTFRFPRDWLDDWPAIVDATDRLIEGWRPAAN